MTKIVVIGGTGLIGSKLVARLAEHGHEAIAASPNSGVNTLTGEGLAEVLSGAQVVVDVSNSPSFEDKAVLDFFTTSTGNLLAAEKTAGVGHHVALSVVGTERLSESGYFRAKLAQEKLIRESGIPYSIVHATQFFEFVKSIADSATDGNTVRLSHALIQPIAADAVASAVARTAVGEPIRGAHTPTQRGRPHPRPPLRRLACSNRTTEVTPSTVGGDLGKRRLFYSGPDRKFVRGPERISGLRSCRSLGRLPAGTRRDPQRLGTRPSAPLAARSQLPDRKQRPSPRRLPRMMAA
jgi:NmrA-like family